MTERVATGVVRTVLAVISYALLYAVLTHSGLDHTYTAGACTVFAVVIWARD